MRTSTALAISAACGLALLAPSTASACGGFFCSNTPVNQSGERIAFVLEDGHVEAHVEILYSGSAKKFAW